MTENQTTETARHQCLNTEVHPPHDFCPGLDYAQVAATRALTVPCPDCYAPAGEACRGNHDGVHLDRRRIADLQNLEHGTCGECGQWMVKGRVLDAPTDAWHPDVDHAAACPVMPDPNVDWPAYAALINVGVSPGRPGVQHFQPATPEQVEAHAEEVAVAASKAAAPVHAPMIFTDQDGDLQISCPAHGTGTIVSGLLSDAQAAAALLCGDQS